MGIPPWGDFLPDPQPEGQLCMSRGQNQASLGPQLCPVLMGQRAKELSGVSFIRALIPFIRALAS